MFFILICFRCINLASTGVPCNSRAPCLLVATGSDIISLDYNNGAIDPIIITNSSRPTPGTAIAYDVSRKYLFWCQGDGIMRSHINGTNIRLLHKFAGCSGLAVDWKSSQLYWTDRSTISVSDLDGNNKRVLLSTNFPLKIALDPERG